MIKSVLDTDFYKVTMMQCVFNNFSRVEAEYKFVCRSEGVDLSPLLRKIKEQIFSLCCLKVNEQDISSLRKLSPVFDDNFLNFLEGFSLKSKYVTIREDRRERGNIELRIKGPWFETIIFETALLAIISQTYCTSKPLEDSNLFREILRDKINYIKSVSVPLKFAEFGTRRRYSSFVQKEVLQELIKEVPNSLIGTSNIYFASFFGINVIGTMAHEFLMSGMGLSNVSLRQSQKYMLEKWISEYKGHLGIALTDTISMDSFLEDFNLFLAKAYDGCRHDSGCPYVWRKTYQTL